MIDASYWTARYFSNIPFIKHKDIETDEEIQRKARTMRIRNYRRTILCPMCLRMLDFGGLPYKEYECKCGEFSVRTGPKEYKI